MPVTRLGAVFFPALAIKSIYVSLPVDVKFFFFSYFIKIDDAARAARGRQPQDVVV